ncbi:DUF1772 domain-containing protein [Actinoalloteichus caeruleus]|uniref:Membrane protein n=1 Tax=Actinoalloteichus caeruleus DSM 43889 TaxID=1120930 RepID=A0ABT1JFX4_ACTCY|nr:anthrone oxygenase family protein [Actinoalloteichus caeruleus]MCP2331066.1 putative membrane protein [Actinoalloteichus caeruleus DSM 43889]
MSALGTGALVAATVTGGLVAGLFTGFAYGVMPALRRVDDDTFVRVMRRINEVIPNPWFLLPFLGTPLLAALAAATHLTSGGGTALPWPLAGLALSLTTVAVTGAVNVPLNTALAATGGTASTARRAFERRWTRANVVRSVTATAAVACLALGLALD